MYISLDIETTGFDPEIDDIIEIGAIKFDDSGKILDKFQTLIKTDKQIPEIVVHLTNIKNHHLKNSPNLKDIKNDFIKFIGKSPIIGHHIEFDTNFLKTKGFEFKNKEYDTLPLSSSIFRNFSSYSLEALCKIFKIKHENSHRALDDAIASMKLFLIIKKEFQLLPADLIKEIQKISKKSPSSLKDFFKGLKAEDSKHFIPIIDNTNRSQITFKKIQDDTRLNPFTLVETNNEYFEILNTIEKKQKGLISIPKYIFDEIIKNKDLKANKIDIFSNYISEKRFSALLKNKEFNKYELQAIIKVLIWKHFTKTQLLSELVLFGEEKNILKQIKDLSKNNKKEINESDLTICSHEYLILNKKKLENLTIFDIESLNNYIKKHNNTFLTLNECLAPIKNLESDYPKDKTLKLLTEKITILFGLIGIFKEKHSEKDFEISQRASNTKEWSQIKDNIKNLIIISAGLEKIATNKTKEELLEWKNILKQLDDFFNKNTKHAKAITTNHIGQPLIRTFKTSNKEDLEKIYSQFKKVTIIDNSIDLNDNGQYGIKTYHMPENCKFIKYKKENKIKLTFSNNRLNSILIKNNFKNIAIIVSAKETLKRLTIQLSKNIKDKAIISQATGSLGKMIELFKSYETDKILILTPNAWLKFPISNKIDKIVIEKIPFTPLMDQELKIQRKLYKNPFLELQLPKAALKLKQLINKASGEYTEIIILDKRLSEQKYSKFLIDVLSDSPKK